jgi:hypothetical protein
MQVDVIRGGCLGPSWVEKDINGLKYCAFCVVYDANDRVARQCLVHKSSQDKLQAAIREWVKAPLGFAPEDAVMVKPAP